jgi:hypothetical protein
VYDPPPKASHQRPSLGVVGAPKPFLPEGPRHDVHAVRPLPAGLFGLRHCHAARTSSRNREACPSVSVGQLSLLGTLSLQERVSPTRAAQPHPSSRVDVNVGILACNPHTTHVAAWFFTACFPSSSSSSSLAHLVPTSYFSAFEHTTPVESVLSHFELKPFFFDQFELEHLNMLTSASVLGMMKPKKRWTMVSIGSFKVALEDCMKY